MKKKRVTVHIIKTRKGEPSKIDPSECEILEGLVIHDYCTQGLAMDWKKAKELHGKITGKDK